MVTRRVWTTVAAGVILAVGGFLVGHVPERTRRIAAEARTEALRVDGAADKTIIRTGQLLGRVLMLSDLVARSDFARAQSLSSAFFDAVRAEWQVASPPGRHEALTDVLTKRDTVTAMLAKADTDVAAILTSIEHRLRVVLGHAVLMAPPGSGPSALVPSTG